MIYGDDNIHEAMEKISSVGPSMYGDDNVHYALEKVAKLPAAIRKGGGGVYGELRRAQRGFGRLYEKGGRLTRSPYDSFEGQGKILKDKLDDAIGLKARKRIGAYQRGEGYWRTFDKNTRLKGSRADRRKERRRILDRAERRQRGYFSNLKKYKDETGLSLDEIKRTTERYEPLASRYRPWGDMY